MNDYLNILSLCQKFPELEIALEEERDRILEIEASKRSLNQKRKLNYLQQAIKKSQNNKTDHNLIRRITNL